MWSLIAALACTPKPTPLDSSGGDTSLHDSDDGRETGGHSGETGRPDSRETGDPRETDDSAAPPAPVFINELMPGNVGAVLDDNGAVSDWLELYNVGETDLDLSGYALSDDWTNPALHVLPEGTTLAAGGHLLLWADGDASLGDAHLGFKLSQDGEGVGVFDPAGEALDWVVYGAIQDDTALARIPDGADTWEEVVHGTPGSRNARVTVTELTLLTSGDDWRYDDTGADLGVEWRAVDYDDGDWSSGPSPLGYGDTHSTTLSYGADTNNKHPTTYLRAYAPLAEDEASNAYAVTLSLLADDGALVWLNGEEAARHHLDEGDIGWSDYANATVSGADETSWTTYEIDPSLLTQDNVLAVEVHQATASSSDLQWDAILTVSTWAESE